jgi:hypothetical protein
MIDDSERANHYGIRVSGADEGTSIGMGYIAETYIDFGEVVMMIVIFLFGVSLGLVYRWMLYHRPFGGLLGLALANSFLFPAALVETSITKLIGGLVVSLLVSWITARVIIPACAPWLNVRFRDSAAFLLPSR